MKIGLCLPSRNVNCKQYNETFLYKLLLKSFIHTQCKQYNYIFCVVIDDDDIVYSNKEELNKIIQFVNLIDNIEIKFISSNGIQKGHVTAMWNRSFEYAYKLGCDYFYQCGDDIEFMDKGWVSECIKQLQSQNDLGVVGPLDWQRELFRKQMYPQSCKFLLTQTFVSRKHMEIFGFYFPPEIINWYCDDWITKVYQEKNLLISIQSHRIINKGGPPRYIPIGQGETQTQTEKLCNNLIKKYIAYII